MCSSMIAISLLIYSKLILPAIIYVLTVWDNILWHVIVIKFEDFRNAHPLYDKKIVMLFSLISYSFVAFSTIKQNLLLLLITLLLDLWILLQHPVLTCKVFEYTKFKFLLFPFIMFIPYFHQLDESFH